MLSIWLWVLLVLCTRFSYSQTTFDFIVVGGGTCGLTVANRLSENANVAVAVVEPGQDVRDNSNVTDVDGFTKAFDTSIDWAYQSAPQKNAGNRQLEYHAGKALGGTSTMNGELCRFCFCQC